MMIAKQGKPRCNNPFTALLPVRAAADKCRGTFPKGFLGANVPDLIYQSLVMVNWVYYENYDVTKKILSSFFLWLLQERLVPIEI